MSTSTFRARVVRAAFGWAAACCLGCGEAWFLDLRYIYYSYMFSISLGDRAILLKSLVFMGCVVF